MPGQSPRILPTGARQAGASGRRRSRSPARNLPWRPVDRRFASPPTAFEEVDVRGLEHDLGRAVEGEVRFRPGDRALYTTGGSHYRQLPIGVVIPRTTDDVVETMRVCRDYRAPVLAHGGGTSLAGQCCNVAVVVDF